MKIKKIITRILLLGLVVTTVAPSQLLAAEVSNRSILIGSSGAGVVTDHSLSFTIATTGSIGSISFEYCTTAYNTCVTPAGLDTTAAALAVQTGATGFTLVSGTNGAPYLTRAASSVNTGTSVSYTLGGITNPTASNTEFWVRIRTYAAIDITGSATDIGVVTFNTANQIVVSGTMPESLIFCVGTSGTDCTNMTGSAVDLGIFSPTSTNSATSVMSASTNAGFGYVITVNGTSMSSGANVIPPMGTQAQDSTGCSPTCTSTIGTSQFGTNVRGNANPAVGTDVSGLGVATGFGGYNAPNAFRFFSGDTVANTSNVTKTNLFTNSYLVNVAGDQAAGVYTATMTYICTATF